MRTCTLPTVKCELSVKCAYACYNVNNYLTPRRTRIYRNRRHYCPGEPQGGKKTRRLVFLVLFEFVKRISSPDHCTVVEPFRIQFYCPAPLVNLRCELRVGDRSGGFILSHYSVFLALSCVNFDFMRRVNPGGGTKN